MTPLPTWLRQLAEIPGATDVLIASGRCQIERGKGLENVDLVLPPAAELEADLRRLALELGVRLDIAHPIADAMLGKTRLHFVMPHGISESASVSVRIHPATPMTLEELVQSSMMTRRQADYLVSEFSERKTILISGPTGSGKTTLLRALLDSVGGRTIAIEQTPELHLDWPAVNLRSRAANVEGIGEISLNDLVVAALRMRPDRIVIGEARQDEFGAFLQAVNNGHPGSATTIHATSLDAVPRRLLTLGLSAGLSPELTGNLVLAGVDLVVQLDRDPNRHLVAIGVPIADDSGFKIVRESK